MNYILTNDGVPVVEPDLARWARWFETANRSLAETHIGEVRVSTVFLGIDHNFAGHGPPVLWKTMVFGGSQDGNGGRYTSAQAALEGHAMWCEQVRS